jgi:peptidyl-prolyl cis-trans isomerase B (cyclophilin B)
VQVPSNQQRREAAKRKLERQLTRRAERAKRRRIVATAITVIGVVVVVGLIYLLVTLNSGNSTAAPGDSSTSAAPPPETTSGPCKYTKTPNQPAAKPVDVPPDVDPTPNAGTAKVLLKTNQGEIPVVIDRAKAPCTAQAIEHLVKSKYYDDTPCHRLTSGDGLKVLQCGDPTGQGNGGPGFSIKDENPKDLKPGPDGQTVIYPKGALAMANAGPGTSGSQFFLVYADSTLPPNYTVFGSIDPAGLATIDKIAAGGITAGQNGPTDGAPKNEVKIQSATAS